jgi:hypothetical protein
MILDFLGSSDKLVVTQLDRLGRDTRDVLNLIHGCEQKGAFVTVLEPARLHPRRDGAHCAHRARHGGPDGAAVHQGAPARWH